MIGRNNPLNIRYSPMNKWKGQCGRTRGFCNFSQLTYGIRAAAILMIRSYRYNLGIEQRLSYAEIIEKFAPPSENPTGNYITYVCNKCLSYPFDCPVSVEDFATLIYYMWCFEQGKTPSLSIADIEAIIIEFDLSKYCSDGSDVC